jgi:DNA-binding NarL/FixJ family response regulator
MSHIRVLLAAGRDLLEADLRDLLDDSSEVDIVAVESHGRDAIDRTAALRPDVVVLDTELTDASGIDVARAVLRRSPEYGLVLLSRHSGPRLVRTALEAGARGEQEPDAPADEPQMLGRLTPRERDVLRLVTEGRSNAQAATILGLSPRSVETYRGRMMEKLGVGDLPALVKLAIRLGVTTLD